MRARMPAFACKTLQKRHVRPSGISSNSNTEDIPEGENRMFDQLVETTPQTKERNARRTYFAISAVGLGAILFSALIFSIFAADLDLTMGDLDMLELLAPIDVTETKLPDTVTEPRRKGGSSAKAPSRMENIARLDESPREIPTTVSTVKSSSKERPALAKFEIGKFDTGSDSGVGTGRGDGTGDGDGDGTGLDDGLGEANATVATAGESSAPPPPPVKPVVTKPVIVNKGVVNSIALSLPKPSLPAAAKLADAGGTVAVKVLVDEKGRVVSADAVSGNVLLRAACEIAARNAKFTPSMLSGTPIKISGVINYNFNNGSITD